MEELKCEICGITSKETKIIKSKKYKKIICNKHRTQLDNYGKILNRTIKDRNEFIFCEEKGIVYVVLYDKHNIELDRAIIDISDYDLIKDLKWGKSVKGYACSKLNGEYITMHSFLLGKNIRNLQIDHINRNKLDNRRCNLRFISRSGNIINTDVKINNSSGTTGVSWCKWNKSWAVSISINKKSIKVGRFKDINNAIYVRFKCEMLYYENFIPNKEIKIKFIEKYEKENGL